MQTMAERQRVAVLGGTFDPVHNGHIALLAGACAELEAIEGWLLPASLPNLRDAPVAAAGERSALLDAAVRGLPAIRVADLELIREGLSYTVDTLIELEQQHPDLECWWVIGADAARHLPHWHRSDEVAKHGRFAVAQRRQTPAINAEELRALGLPAERTRLLAVTVPDISAGEVRDRVARGADIADLVPAAVAARIRERGLYRTTAPVHNAGG